MEEKRNGQAEEGIYIKCPDCKGTGILNEPPQVEGVIYCPACHGAGEIRKEAWIEG